MLMGSSHPSLDELHQKTRTGQWRDPIPCFKFSDLWVTPCGGAIWVTPKSSSQGFTSLSTGRFIYLFNLMLPFLHPIFFPWSLEIVFDLTIYSHQNKTKTDNSNKTKNLILTDNLAMFANSSKLLSFSWFLSQDAILDLFLLLWAV